MMIPPDIPENEEQRLAVLYQLNILDTEGEERFDRVTRIACKLFDVPIAVISFLEAERQWMKSTFGFDIKEAKRKTSFCGHVILSNDIMVVEDTKKDLRFHDNPFVLNHPYFRFYVGAPLQIKSCNVGVLCLIDKVPRSKKEVDAQVVKDLTEMVQLELESLQLSTTDELTGLTNRRGFLKIGDYLFQASRREDKPFCLLFFDLDGFKQINDQYGHAEGDQALKLFSKCLLEEFRKSDIIARLGGDEFCVFCSGLNKDNVHEILIRLRKRLDTFKTTHYTIRFSIGLVQFDNEKHTKLEDLLALADSEMYDHKKSKL